MRLPPDTDIHAPELPQDLAWLNTPFMRMATLLGRHAVLLEIFTTEGVGTEVVRSAAAKRRTVGRIRKA